MCIKECLFSFRLFWEDCRTGDGKRPRPGKKDPRNRNGNEKTERRKGILGKSKSRGESGHPGNNNPQGEAIEGEMIIM